MPDPDSSPQFHDWNDYFPKLHRFANEILQDIVKSGVTIPRQVILGTPGAQGPATRDHPISATPLINDSTALGKMALDLKEASCDILGATQIRWADGSMVALSSYNPFIQLAQNAAEVAALEKANEIDGDALSHRFNSIADDLASRQTPYQYLAPVNINIIPQPIQLTDDCVLRQMTPEEVTHCFTSYPMENWMTDIWNTAVSLTEMHPIYLTNPDSQVPEQKSPNPDSIIRVLGDLRHANGLLRDNLLWYKFIRATYPNFMQGWAQYGTTFRPVRLRYPLIDWDDEMNTIFRQVVQFSGDESVRLALRRLADSLGRASSDDAFLDVMIGLEAVLLDDNLTEVVYRFTQRVAFLSTDPKGRSQLKKTARDLYNKRSKVAHGRSIQLKEDDVKTARALLRQVVRPLITENRPKRTEEQWDALIFGDEAGH